MTTDNKRNLHSRPNRLSDADRKAWWAANSDALKGLPAEVQGVTTANVDSNGNPRAPYKAKNTWGYDLDEWYRGDWSPREAAGKSEGYEPKGLPATVTVVDNNGDLNTEITDAERARLRDASRKMQNATGTCPDVEPWQHHVKETAPKAGLTSPEPTWADVRGDLPLPTWTPVAVPLTEAEQREANRVLALPQKKLYAVTWTSDDKDGFARLLWTARMRYAKQSRNPEKGARVIEAQFSWKATGQDVWHAERELNGHITVNSIDGMPNPENMELEGAFGATPDPLSEMAQHEALQQAVASLTDKQRLAIRQKVHGKAVTCRPNLQAAQKKAQAFFA